MARFNRNIITPVDAARVRAGNPPKTLDASPPAGAIQPAGTAAGGLTAAGGVPVASEDDYLTKLIKYVPLEVLGAYLFIESVVKSNVTDSHERAIWLGSLLLGFAVITGLYDWRVLTIVRWTQVLVSIVGFGVYVFAIGGWFATTTWYHDWYAALILPLFGLFVAIVPVRPLPDQPVDKSTH